MDPKVKPPRKQKPASKTPPTKQKETISEKLTQVLVTIGEVRVQQTNFQKQLEKWTLEQHTESLRVNSKFMELQATDRANGDAVSKVSAQLEKVLAADHSTRFGRNEADILYIKEKTNSFETLKLSTQKLNNSIRLQWVVLGILTVIGAYLYGTYQGGPISP